MIWIVKTCKDYFVRASMVQDASPSFEIGPWQDTALRSWLVAISCGSKVWRGHRSIASQTNSARCARFFKIILICKSCQTKMLPWSKSTIGTMLSWVWKWGCCSATTSSHAMLYKSQSSDLQCALALMREALSCTFLKFCEREMCGHDPRQPSCWPCLAALRALQWLSTVLEVTNNFVADWMGLSWARRKLGAEFYGWSVVSSQAEGSKM